MKKQVISRVPLLALIMLILFIGCSKLTKSAEYELGVGAAYTKTLTGADKKVNSRVELTRFVEVKKLTDWEYGLGLHYQLKSKVDELLVPTLAIRYYPLNKMPIFAEGNIGLAFNTAKSNYGGRYGIALGLGKTGVTSKVFIDLTDGEVYDRLGKTLNVGMGIGYRL